MSRLYSHDVRLSHKCEVLRRPQNTDPRVGGVDGAIECDGKNRLPLTCSIRRLRNSLEPPCRSIPAASRTRLPSGRARRAHGRRPRGQFLGSALSAALPRHRPAMRPRQFFAEIIRKASPRPAKVSPNSHSCRRLLWGGNLGGRRGFLIRGSMIGERGMVVRKLITVTVLACAGCAGGGAERSSLGALPPGDRGLGIRQDLRPLSGVASLRRRRARLACGRARGVGAGRVIARALKDARR